MFDLDKTMNEHIYPALEEAQQSPEDTGRILAKILSSVFNTYSTKEIAKAFSKNIIIETHKTIQQQIVQAIIYFFKAMSECQPWHIDDRNKAAVKAAQIAYKALEDANMTKLPLI